MTAFAPTADASAWRSAGFDDLEVPAAATGTFEPALIRFLKIGEGVSLSGFRFWHISLLSAIVLTTTGAVSVEVREGHAPGGLASRLSRRSRSLDGSAYGAPDQAVPPVIVALLVG